MDHVSEIELNKETSTSGLSPGDQHVSQVESDIRRLSKFYGDGSEEEPKTEYQDASDFTHVVSMATKNKQKKKKKNLQIKNDYNTRFKAGASKSSSISF